MTPEEAIALLEEFRAGSVSREKVLQAFQAAPVADLGFAVVDRHRSLRKGFPEVIFGAGKTTLFRMIAGELGPESGTITLPRNARLGRVEQEAPGGPGRLVDFVLDADKERTALMAEAETATDPMRIAEIQTRLVDIDAHSAPARAAEILSGLGFDHEAQQRALSEFSGGWRMRVALAAVLFSAPDLLLLDEPTNYLDLEGTLWLMDYLARYPHTVIVISHDRDLLNQSVDQIMHLSEGKLRLYKGGYDNFEKQRAEEQEVQARFAKKQAEERKHLEAFINRFKAKASKARQAQSRVKRLEKMTSITPIIDTDVLPFHFPSPERPLSPPIVAMDNVGCFKADAKRLRQILFNLLSNAIGFSSPGQTVTLAAFRRNGEVIFKVTDCGRGISPDVLDKIFDRFESYTNGSRHRGVGLGLSIVRAFMELHGGKVFVDSAPGEGTTVTCVFPASLALDQTAQIVNQRGA